MGVKGLSATDLCEIVVSVDEHKSDKTICNKYSQESMRQDQRVQLCKRAKLDGNQRAIKRERGKKRSENIQKKKQEMNSAAQSPS